MNRENENDELPRRVDGPSKDMLNAWLASLLVALVLLGLFLFAKKWRDGSNKAKCVMNIRNFQTATRSFSGMQPEIASPTAPVEVHAVYKFMSSPPLPKITPLQCPAGGSYTAHGSYGARPGTVFLHCSHPDHAPTPAQAANW